MSRDCISEHFQTDFDGDEEPSLTQQWEPTGKFLKSDTFLRCMAHISRVYRIHRFLHVLQNCSFTVMSKFRWANTSERETRAVCIRSKVVWRFRKSQNSLSLISTSFLISPSNNLMYLGGCRDPKDFRVQQNLINSSKRVLQNLSD